MYICRIDNAEFETEKALHSHIARTLKTKLSEYYPKYFPRQDKLTREPIEFSDKDHYFSSLFVSRENLIEYVKKNPRDISTIEEVIRLRAQLKGLKFAPSTVEARTSILPTPLVIQRLGLDYNKICQRAGLKTRYNYNQFLRFDNSRAIDYIVDTREQKPLPLRGSVTVSKLDFGDYTSSSHYKKVFVERKSIVDLCGTLSQGFERFKMELNRAEEAGCYIVVMVEDPLKRLDAPIDYVKASPTFIKARLREIAQEFSNVQFLFVNGRVEMISIISKIFRMENDIRTVDCQFFYDNKDF